MNPDLSRLQPYPFEKLAKLKAEVTPPEHLDHIALSIGEPQHPAPAFVIEEVTQQLPLLAKYPLTKGNVELRESIANWLTQRFSLKPGTVDAESNVLPVNGTREALFAFAQAVVDRAQNPLVLSPNPFYQIYEGAAFLAGAEPYFLNTTSENNFQPDLDNVPAEIWQRCQLIFLCSPGNPTGAVVTRETLTRLIELSDEHDFIIASDECYSELYPDENNPPVGLLQIAAELSRDDYKNCVVFHSLSKRSNLPGLRSGFVAGDAEVMKKFLLYRTYHGCAMPVHHQIASTKAWADEGHVLENRDLYREKFQAVLEVLGDVMDVSAPDAGFYLWPKTPISDTEFAQRLFAEQNVTVVPGSYLSRDAHGINPGSNHVRMALVATLDECVEAANRIKTFVQTL